MNMYIIYNIICIIRDTEVLPFMSFLSSSIVAPYGESCWSCLYQNHQEFIYLTVRVTPFFLGDWVPMHSALGPTPDGASEAP